MKKISRVLALAGLFTVLTLGADSAMAQRGDPAQFRQRRLDRLKEQMNVTDDAEWKVLEGAMNKVMDAQQDVIGGRFGGMGGGGPRGGGGTGGTNGTNSTAGGRGGRGGGGGRFGGTPSAEAEALQQAIDDNASSDVINTKLKALRESNAAKEAKLDEAQANLRKLLTPRQEAVAVLGGMLK
jgi:hypothetical protein